MNNISANIDNILLDINQIIEEYSVNQNITLIAVSKKKSAEAIKIAPKLKSSEIIVVNSCGDSLKDKDIIKDKLGSYIR